MHCPTPSSFFITLGCWTEDEENGGNSQEAPMGVCSIVHDVNVGRKSDLSNLWLFTSYSADVAG